jgi:hypothetical protein
MPGAQAMRPQLLVVPLFLIAAVVLSQRRARPRALWAIPIVGIFWANLHGSFVLLPLLCAVAFVADLVDRDERRLVTGALVGISALAPVATPWGLSSYAYAYRLSTSTVVRTVIDEWRPIWQQRPAGVLFAVTCVGIVVAIVRGNRHGLRVEDWLTLGLFTALAVPSGRNLIWWSLVVPPVLGALLASPASSTWTRTSMRIVRIALAAILALALVRLLREEPQQVLADAPPGITAAVRGAAPGAHVFAGWWFSWLEDSVPDDQMFVDARAELFPSEVWDEYFAISRADPGWAALLDRRGVDVVVASRSHQAPLIDAMSGDAHWRQLYADAEGVVFERSDAA